MFTETGKLSILMLLGAIVWIIICTLLTPTPLAMETSPYLYQYPTTSTTQSTQSIGIKTITAYTTYESCHNPQNDTCLMTNGKPVHLGVVACPREYPLGTKFLIDGNTYTCEDRTSVIYDGRFDIFLGDGYDNYLKAKEFGIKYLEVKLIQ